jgi:hypothetical protein
MATQTLSPARLSRATMARQMLLKRERLQVPEAVHRLCALQAQEPKPPHLALWSRLTDFTARDLLTALHERTVLRVTLLRGTLHLVHAADYPVLRVPLQPVLAESFMALGERAADIELDRVLPAARTAYAAGPMTFEELRARLAAAFPGLDERVLGYAVRTNLPLVMVPTEDRWGYPRVSRFTPVRGRCVQEPHRHPQSAGACHLSARRGDPRHLGDREDREDRHADDDAVRAAGRAGHRGARTRGGRTAAVRRT